MKMNHGFSWQYDEFKQVGTDYGSKAEVEIYDSSHADFRDMEAESIRILDSLEIKRSNVLIDFGSGTGTFAIQAARRCARVYAVDVSRAMIDRAEAKAIKAGTSNIEFHHAGFLTYEHNDSPVDAVVTTFAFHHLPDFWKGIALKRVNSMLKPGGQLYIHDVILEETNAVENIAALIDKLATAGGKLLREDTERHFRDEYSTYDWVMDGLLSRSGFTIKSKHIEGGVLGTYICTKN
ncbi:MAG: class I SAM-dependent methyltransferase [Nitrospirae bacterium]|nr:class I SAM-dependent methyltransferase [Nitrospirota bacterium]